MSTQPIGIFDSGMGGLSVVKSIRQRLPKERLIYYADTKHSPYGGKDQAFILERGRYICDFFVEQGVKLVVVACNTATVSILPQLRSEFGLPFVGVEPGVKPASHLTKTGKVAVLATEYTAKSDQLKYLVKRYANEYQVELQGCPGFVGQIESQNIHGKETEALVRKYIEPLLEKGVDTFVLGCTHYAFLLPVIRKVTGEAVNIVQTQDAVAGQVVTRLANMSAVSNISEGGIHFFGSNLRGSDIDYYLRLLQCPT